MKKGVRTICHDEALRVEAYRLEGFLKPFPNHFHDYYVVGYMNGGERYLSCKNREYTLCEGDMVLFNPEDNHACAQFGSEPLHYLGLNIPKATMLDLAGEITGVRALPHFGQTVVNDSELAGYLVPLHTMLMSGWGEFEKEELLLLMTGLLLERYGKPFEAGVPECREEIGRVCTFLQSHYAEPISLDDICRQAGFSKSTLLRSFTKAKGMTPYRYLQTVRVEEAKKRLEQGVPPVEAAMQTGFSDQSHFTKFFTMFIGLSPGVYRDIFRAPERKKPEREEQDEPAE